MFGDIVSDLCAGLVRRAGFAPSAKPRRSLRRIRADPRISAEIRGQYKVNPIAMLLTSKLMLDLAQGNRKGTRLETAIAASSPKAKCAPKRYGWQAST